MSVLRTKLFIPQLTETLVFRPILYQRLDQKKRLTLVSASAGFGKTTLVSAWVQEQTDSLCIWLSLDEGDNDPVRFFTHLLAALHAKNDQLEASIQSDMLNNMPQSAIWTILINNIIDVGEPLILILDDYHVIENPMLHGGLAFLIDHAPPLLSLIITTRVDPPFPLARLRAKGHLTELRSADLRFSLDETLQFFNDKLTLDIDPSDIQQLQNRTEGWIASLQLAGVALRQTDHSQQDLIQNFSGSDKYVMDYLVSDVLFKLSAEDQNFLTQTAYLGRFCAPLCNEVRNTNDSQSYLDRFEKANLFLFPLDNQRNWYRYHQLFAELLKVHGQHDAVFLKELHQRASHWFESQGLIEEAVQHAFEAPDADLAVRLISQYAHPLFAQGKVGLVEVWLKRLPASLFRNNAELYLIYGLSLFRTGQFEALRSLIKERPEQLTTQHEGEYISLQAQVAFLDGEFSQALDLAKQALEKLDPDSIGVQLPPITLMGWCYERNGDLAAAIDAHAQTLPLAYAAGSFTGVVASLGKLTLLHAQIGNTDQALACYQELVDGNYLNGEVEIPLAGMAHIGVGVVQQDAQKIRQGIELCRQWGALYAEVLVGYNCLLDLKRQQGLTAEVSQIEEELDHLLASSDMPQWVNKIIYPKQDQPLLDPLTPREQEILGWLSMDLAVPQIAQKLVIGESTVRSHIKKVYAKLSVHSRHEAVQTAKELNLLSSPNQL